MFYQYTGQPGHGKTVLAIENALEMKAKADKLHAEDPAKHPLRELYVCNVRDFNHGKCGALELTPAEVLTWHNDPRFDHAIFLIDEAYEHGMFPRRPPGRPVPEHVQQIAKHRHRGIDFIMICQSPKKQMDDFLHDLIEEHYHIRRRFGMPFVHVRRFDRFEPNPEKTAPLTTGRRRYPTEIFKLYTSTKYDTSEKRIPWFYWAGLALVVVLCIAGPYTWNRINNRFAAEPTAKAGPERQRADGAPATAAKPGAQAAASKSRGTPAQYVESLLPRVPGQPWTAPIYDSLTVGSEPPRLFCMASGAGLDGQGERQPASCSCITEQGTRYVMATEDCRRVAREGQYEPFRKQAERSDGMQIAGPSNDAQGLRVSPETVSQVNGGVIGPAPRAMGTFPESVQHVYSVR